MLDVFDTELTRTQARRHARRVSLHELTKVVVSCFLVLKEVGVHQLHFIGTISTLTLVGLCYLIHLWSLSSPQETSMDPARQKRKEEISKSLTFIQ